MARCKKCITDGITSPNRFRFGEAPEVVQSSLFGDNDISHKIHSKKEVEMAAEERFERWWDLYNKKTGRPKALKRWLKLSIDTHRLIWTHTSKYVEATPDKQFRKGPDAYLNQQTWLDEVIIPGSSDNVFRTQAASASNPYLTNGKLDPNKAVQEVFGELARRLHGTRQVKTLQGALMSLSHQEQNYLVSSFFLADRDLIENEGINKGINPSVVASFVTYKKSGK